MTKVTVEIDKETDLPVLEAFLNNSGWKYHMDEDDWGDLSDAEIKGIQAGLEDIDAGRVFTHEEAMAKINATIKQLTDKK